MGYHELFRAFHMFHRLNIFSVLPEELSKSDFVTLQTIAYGDRHCVAGQKNIGRPEEGIRISEIARITRTLPPAVSRTLRGLEAQEYIIRIVDKNDRRNTYVEITDKGKEVLAKTESELKNFFESVLGRTDPDKIEKLTGYLHELYDITSAELELRKKTSGK